MLSDEEKAVRQEIELLSDSAADVARLISMRGIDAMPLEMAAAIARKVMLHLYRGSMESARASLEEGWSSHAEEEVLIDGPELLIEPLSKVLHKNDIRLLNQLEAAGIMTVKDLIISSAADWLAIDNVGPSSVAKLSVLKMTLKRRANL